MNTGLIENIKSLYLQTESYVRLRNEKSETFRYSTGLKQGCILSPILFNAVLDEVLKASRQNLKSYIVGSWRMRPVKVTELCYADDMLVIAETEAALQHNMNTLNEEFKKHNMKINEKKTKSMIISVTTKTHQIFVGETPLEQVKSYKYLGAQINSRGNIEDEIKERIAKTGRLFNAIKGSILGKREIPEQTKVEVAKKVMKPVLTFGSETWTTTESQRKKLTSVEMRFLRKIKGKTRRDRIRNEVFRRDLGIIPVEESIKQSQLRWLGHITRIEEERLVKQVHEARQYQKQRRGRPRKTWSKEVREAVEDRGIQWADVTRIAWDRKTWKDIWKGVHQ